MSRDVRDLLLASARAPGAGPRVDSLWERGRRRRRRVVAAGLAGVVAVAAVAAAVLLPLVRPAAPVVLAPAETPTDEPVPACEPPPYRPTYLPWLGDGETAGEPDARLPGSREQPSGVLYWVDDPEAFDQEFPAYSGAAVTVTTNFELGEHPAFDQPDARVPVQGHEGVLVWSGDPGIGGVSVTWREHADPCGSYSVGFDTTRWVLDHVDFDPERFDDAEGEDVDELMRELEEAVEAELLRVVDSLQPAGPG